MQITIVPCDAPARTVSATFVHGGVTHTRAVNACFDDTGGYDEAATAARVAEVARGVENKIALGVITNPPKNDSTVNTAVPGSKE